MRVLHRLGKIGRLMRTGQGLAAHRDTLRRLLRGDFQDLDEAARREKVDQIIQISATASAMLAAAPVPWLDLPVQAAMVGAIAKVRGVRGSSRSFLVQIVAALGGGLVLRQALRLLPFGGITQASRVYGATWALGRAGDLYFRRGSEVSPEELRELFRDTMKSKFDEQARRLADEKIAAELRELEQARATGSIGDAEYLSRRAQLLGPS